ncbi:hypothetical protein AK830_g3052 [Neonectria ditissima]|uniref:Aga1 a-agglutinin anchor subunit n=1 Tax=Neonectria ditissima TaxID=78410 RepID=A0A0P7BRX5_9HYPO|nr:hypothetical protein AK830_g3052 [Neonectria ditissima]
MSSSLQRSRSLRKPAATTTTAPADLTAHRQDTEPRHSSPSRLPVKPLTRSATAAKTSTSTSTSTRTLRSGSTPTSSLARTSSIRQPTASKESPRRETSRYPPSTTSTRPRPAVRPTSSDGPAAPTRRIPPSHARAKSTTTVTPATTVSNLRGASVLRPSSGGSTSSASKLRVAPVLRPPSGGSTSSASSTTTRTVHARKVSGHEKPVASVSANAAAPAQAQPRLRPAFSTLQQHYSPAKSAAPKPLTSTFLAPPSPSKLPANVAASAETSRLQAELLQLHLLHQDAAVVDAEWRSSARKKLGARFAQLSADGTQVDGHEKAETERENVLALRNWAVGGGLEERIQTLDAVINGVWTLGEPGGRYARVVRRFERWVDRMCEIEDVRRGDGALLQEQDVLFISELDAAWKDEYMGLIRRLDGMKRQLQELGQLPDEDGEERSSLRRMMEDSWALVEGMLAELALMEEIEQEALAREDDWIEKMNRDEDADDTPRAGAIWRVV